MHYWYITAPVGSVITLRVEDFHLDPSACIQVVTTNVLGMPRSQVGYACGTYIPKVIRSTGSYMTIATKPTFYDQPFGQGFNGTVHAHTCAPGMYGIDNCDNACNCSGHAWYCDNVDGNCSCNAYFEGRHCEIDIDECQNPKTCKLTQTCVNVVWGYYCLPACDFTYTADIGFFNSAGYPNYYLANDQCSWTIQGKTGSVDRER
ncbi:multiple epidermal growth factor-like domains protein 6 [Physella acuta]|uniref:multiple epidermal growth factor-like domains protein 6 n=1 Tax=Physella acuta TaxID=109671 RepID=UPI0027DB9B6B|nr:multiple epidermal growth factor-like domains protein 6 [Physella acuta]